METFDAQGKTGIGKRDKDQKAAKTDSHLWVSRAKEFPSEKIAD